MIGEVHQRLQIARAARIVHEDVERAEMRDHRVDEAFEIGLLHHVARDEDGPVASAQFFEHFRALLGIAGEQRDLAAFGQKRLGDPAPHARRAAGDRGDFAFQFHSSLLCLGGVAGRAPTCTLPK